MLNIYITDLAAYNNGHLIGEWVSLPICRDELALKIQEILENGSKKCGYGEVHEEYFITDYEFITEFKLFDVGEYSNPFTLNEEIEKVEDFESYDLKRISFLIENNLVSDLNQALSRYEDVVIYEDMTLIDVVEQYIEETVDFTDIPEIISRNIDYLAIASDFEISGEYFEVDRDIFQYTS